MMVPYGCSISNEQDDCGIECQHVRGILSKKPRGPNGRQRHRQYIYTTTDAVSVFTWCKFIYLGEAQGHHTLADKQGLQT